MGTELADLQRRIGRVRMVRTASALAAVIESAGLTVWLAAGHLVTALIMAAVVALMVATVALQTVLIRRLRRQEGGMLRDARPRPDYAAIAVMEREIWGRAFSHAGAPWQCGWPAWCAPGREAEAAEALAARGILVTRVTGHQGIPDGEVILVNPDSGFVPGCGDGKVRGS